MGIYQDKLRKFKVQEPNSVPKYEFGAGSYKGDYNPNMLLTDEIKATIADLDKTSKATRESAKNPTLLAQETQKSVLGTLDTIGNRNSSQGEKEWHGGGGPLNPDIKDNSSIQPSVLGTLEAIGGRDQDGWGNEKRKYKEIKAELDQVAKEFYELDSFASGRNEPEVKSLVAQKQKEVDALKKEVDSAQYAYQSKINTTPNWFNSSTNSTKREITNLLKIYKATDDEGGVYKFNTINPSVFKAKSTDELATKKEQQDFNLLQQLKTVIKKQELTKVSKDGISTLDKAKISDETLNAQVQELLGSNISSQYYQDYKDVQKEYLTEWIETGKMSTYFQRPSNWEDNAWNSFQIGFANIGTALINQAGTDMPKEARQLYHGRASSFQNTFGNLINILPTAARLAGDIYGDVTGDYRLSKTSKNIVDNIKGQGELMAHVNNKSGGAWGYIGSGLGGIMDSAAIVVGALPFTGSAVAGAATGGNLFGAASGASFYNQLKDKNYSTIDSLLIAVPVGYSIAWLERIGFESWLANSGATSALSKGFAAVVGEGVTESIQTFDENVITNIFLDERRGWFDGVLESGIWGGIGGGLMSPFSIFQPQIANEIILEVRNSVGSSLGEDTGGSISGLAEDSEEKLKKEAGIVADKIVDNLNNTLVNYRTYIQKAIGVQLDSLREQFTPIKNPNTPEQPKYNNEYFDEVKNMTENLESAINTQLEGETEEQYLDRVMNSTDLKKLYEYGKGDQNGAFENITKMVDKQTADFNLVENETIKTPSNTALKTDAKIKPGETYVASELFDSNLFKEEPSLANVKVEITDRGATSARFDPQTQTIYIKETNPKFLAPYFEHELQHYHDVVNLGLEAVDASFQSITSPLERRAYTSLFENALGQGLSPDLLRQQAKILDIQASAELGTGHKTIENYLNNVLSYTQGTPDTTKLQIDKQELTQALSLLNPSLISSIPVNFSMKGGKQGQADFQKGTITLFKDALKNGNFTRTTIHEYWHLLGRYLTKGDIQSVEQQYNQDKAKYTKENPNWEKSINAQNYRYTSMEEFFAEIMTDETMLQVSQLKSKPRSILGYAKTVFNRIMDVINPTVQRQIFNKLKNEKNLSIQRMNRMDVGRIADMPQFNQDENVSDDARRAYEENVMREIDAETSREMGGEFIQKETQALISMIKKISKGTVDSKRAKFEEKTGDIEEFKTYLRQNGMEAEAKMVDTFEERVDEAVTEGIPLELEDAWSKVTDQVSSQYGKKVKKTRELAGGVSPKSFNSFEQFETSFKNVMRDKIRKGAIKAEVDRVIGELKELPEYKAGDIGRVKTAITEYARGRREAKIDISKTQSNAKKSIMDSIKTQLSAKDVDLLSKGQLNTLLRSVSEAENDADVLNALFKVGIISEGLRKRVAKTAIKKELGKYKLKKGEKGQTSISYELLRRGLKEIYYKEGGTLRTKEENQKLMAEIQDGLQNNTSESPIDYQDMVTYALLSESTKGLNDMNSGELEAVFQRIKDTKSLARDSFLIKQIDRASHLIVQTQQAIENLWTKHSLEINPENRKNVQKFLKDFISTADVYDRGFAQIISLLDSIQGGRFFKDAIYQPIAEGNKKFYMAEDKHDTRDQDFLEKTYGKKGRSLDKEIAKAGKEIYIGDFIDGNENKRHLRFTPGQMTDIYISSKMDANKKAMYDNGVYIGGNKAENRVVYINDEILKAVEDKMTPEQKKMADYIINGVEDKELTKDVVDAYQKKYNKPFPFVKGGYWIMNRRYMGSKQKGIGAFESDFEGKTILSPSSFKERVKNSNPLVMQDAWTKFQNWRADMLRFVAYDESLTNAKAVLTSQDFKSEFVEKYGNKAYRHLVDSFDYTANNGKTYSDVFAKVANKIRSMLSVSFIGGKTRNILSQGSSSIAAVADMPVTSFTEYFIKTMASPKKAWDKMQESPLVRFRHKKAGFTRGMLEAESRQFKKYGTTPSKLAMYFTKIGDIAGVVGAGYTVYSYNYDKNIAQGMDEVSADKTAMQDAENFVISTQQSSLPEYANFIMQSHPALRSTGAFQQAQSMYRAKGYEAMNTWLNKGSARWEAKNFAEMAKKVAAYHVALPAMYEITRGNLNPVSIVSKSVATPVSGFMGAGIFVEYGIKYALYSSIYALLKGDEDDLDDLVPFVPTQLGAEALKIFQKTVKSMNDLISGKDDKKDIQNLLEFAGILTGVPVKNLKEEAIKIGDVFTGKNTEVLRMLETEWQNNKRIESEFETIVKDGKYDEALSYYKEQQAKGYFDGIKEFDTIKDEKAYLRKLDSSIETKMRNIIKDKYGIELLTFSIDSGLSTEKKAEKEKRIENSKKAIIEMPEDEFKKLIEYSSKNTAKGLRKVRNGSG